MRLRRALVGALLVGAFALVASLTAAPPAPGQTYGITPSDVPVAFGGSGGSVLPTRSWYVTTANPAIHAEAGCAMGKAQAAHPGARSGVVALIFGGMSPAPSAPGGGGDWVFDVYRRRAVPSAEVVAAAGAYADAYQRCVQPATDARLVLVVSTTTSSGQIDAAAGAAMARVAAAVTARVEPVDPQVWVLGGNDIELGYVGPGPARAFVQGYVGVATRPMVTIGDAAGCPGDRVPQGDDCGSAEHPDWSAADVWAVNGGIGPTWALPGIYVVDGIQARQWANLDRFARATAGRPIQVLGALSQTGACRERPCTDRVRNTSEVAWSQLSGELGRSGLHSSDMGWLNDPADPPLHR